MKYYTLFLLIGLLARVTLAQECLPDYDRVDCHPDPGATPASCAERGCTWCDATTPPEEQTPTCFFPRTWGYKMVGDPVNTGHGFKVQLERTTTASLFGGDATELTLEADFQSDYRLRIRISDDKPRWEVPLSINPPATNLSDPLYDLEFRNEPAFSFKVTRKSTGSVLFDSSLGGLTFADQFIQIAFKIANTDVYGIGENEQHSLRHSFENRPQFSLWTRDQFPDHNANMYGVHPQFTVLEDDGNAYVFVVINSNAQEFEMHPNPGIVYKTIGGILDMYLFLGPTPEQTAQQYSEAVGRYPLPPYWALGYHLCRHGLDTLDNMKATVDRMIASEIPYDVQYGDIDIMDRNLDFTISDRFDGLTEYVHELKSKGLHYMTILDPCISAVEGDDYLPYFFGNGMNVWMTRSDGATPVHAKVWPDGACHFPDFSKPNTRVWWNTFIEELHSEKMEFDALWIDMNEPANFVAGDLEKGCANNSLNYPPFYPRSLQGDGKLYDRTICPDHIAAAGKQYDTHSLYGWYESKITYGVMKEVVKKRTFILSRSTFIGSGQWTAHWTGDNYSNFENMFFSIIGILQFSLFGIPFAGADICGHQRDAPAQVCQRWHQLGAFYPFARNHNAYGNVDQDPAAFNGQIINSTRKAHRVRYTLLPYLYSLMAHHEMRGDTVARPMWSVFPKDKTARGIDQQFLWGSGILITPVLEEDAVTVSGYFPDARFYDYYTGEEVQSRATFVNLSAPLDHIPVHVVGGNIIPTQEPAVNTERSQNNPFGLIVALNDNEEASGNLYFDDGNSFDPIQTGDYFLAQVKAANKSVEYKTERDSYPGMSSKVLDTVRLLGVSTAPSSITVNGKPHSNFTMLPSKEVFIQGVNLGANANFVLQYK